MCGVTDVSGGPLYGGTVGCHSLGQASYQDAEAKLFNCDRAAYLTLLTWSTTDYATAVRCNVHLLSYPSGITSVISIRTFDRDAVKMGGRIDCYIDLGR